MTEKRISSYVVHKHDIEVNWNASNLVPEKGQFIVYDKEINSEGNISTLPEGRTEPYTYERFKIGDGIRTVKELPFNNEIYIGDGDMPEGATIQIIMDAVDEEENLMNQLEEYIDSKVEEGLSGVDTKIENSLNELDTEDIKYSVEGSFVHQQGFNGTLHEAIYDITNAIANNYGNSQQALYDVNELRNNVNELSENMSSMGESFGSALWSENGLEPRVSELEAFLGYTDDDIIGLSADFENNSFTRLAGAKGLEAGEDFNKFPVYRDRVRCNVADDGTIKAICTPNSNPYTVLLDQSVDFTKMGGPDDSDDVGGVFTSNLLVTPHIVQTGSPLRFTVINNTTNQTTYINSTLESDSEHHIDTNVFGTFVDRQGRTISLNGFFVVEYDDSQTIPKYYTGDVNLFCYPYCQDDLTIKVELLTNGYSILCDTQSINFSKMGSPEDPDSCGGSGPVLMFTNVPESTDIGKKLKVYIHNLVTGETTENETTLGIRGSSASLGKFYYSGKEYDLQGWPLGERNGENSMAYYEDGFQTFVYDYYQYPIEVTILIQKEEIYTDDGSNGQVMVYQPAFYYKVAPVKLEKQEDGIGYHIRKANYYISSIPKPGFKLHPAFYDTEGNEIRYILYSAYEGSFTQLDEHSYLLQSIANAIPEIKGSWVGEESAQRRGECWHNQDIRVFSANQLLMMIEYGTCNLQQCLGKGVVNMSNASQIATTGFTAFLGNKSGKAASITVNGTEYSVDGKTSISYRGIENPYGNTTNTIRHVWGEGYRDNPNKIKIRIEDYSNQSDGGFGEFCGFTAEDGYCSAFGYNSEKYDWLLFPSEGNGSSIDAIGDLAEYDQIGVGGGSYCSFGGNNTDGDGAGLFCCAMIAGTDAGGCRLVYIPKNTEKDSTIV